MRLCIPTGTGEGLTAPLFGHFGSAPYFHLVDVETGAIETLDNAGRVHEHGMCRPMDGLEDKAIDAVIVRGIGRNAFERIRAAGAEVYLSEAASVRDVLDEARAGTLRPLDPALLCGGGRNHHGSGHDEEGAHTFHRPH